MHKYSFWNENIFPRCTARPCLRPKLTDVQLKPLSAAAAAPEHNALLKTVLSRTAVKSPAAAASSTEPNISPSGKLLNCKVCERCRTPDCGTCNACLDKKKFGGPNLQRRRCEQRRCVQRSGHAAPASAEDIALLPSSDIVDESADEEDIEEDEVDDMEAANEPPESLTDFIEKGLSASPGKTTRENYLTKHNYKVGNLFDQIILHRSLLDSYWLQQLKGNLISILNVRYFFWKKLFSWLFIFY